VLTKLTAADPATSQSRRKAARAAFEKVLAADPAHVQASHQLGLVLAESGDLAGAEKAFRRTLELDPNNRAATYQLGNLLVRAGRKEEAKPVMERFAQLSAREEGLETEQNRLIVSQGQIQSRLRIASEQLDAGEVDAALRVAREATEVAPDSAPARALHAAALLAAKRLPEALAEAEEAVRLGPGEKGAVKVLARVRMAGGDLAGAEKLLGPLAEGAKDAELWYILATAQGAQEKYAESASSFGRSLALAPDTPGVLLGLGLAQEKLGRKPDARKTLERLLAIQPQNEAARAAIARL
jgi:Flp pilus assembly protein TadD